MTIRNPEEYFPSYLRYIFEKTLTWPIFKKEEGNRSPCAAKLIENYICLCVAGADIVADKKLKDKTERLQYKRHARRVAEENVSYGEEAMKQIVEEHSNNAELTDIERWQRINEKYADKIQNSEFGKQIERILFFAEGKTPKGENFSENMKHVAEERLIPEINTELGYMLKFMRMYLLNKENTKAGGVIS